MIAQMKSKDLYSRLALLWDGGWEGRHRPPQGQVENDTRGSNEHILLESQGGKHAVFVQESSIAGRKHIRFDYP